MIVAAVVLVVTFLSDQEKFMGSNSELLGLLLFGLTFDLSSSKLLDFAGQLAAKPKS